MRVTPPHDVIGLVGAIARRADEILVRSAARNAALSVQTHRIRELDDLRMIRDLERLPAARSPRATGASRR